MAFSLLVSRLASLGGSALLLKYKIILETESVIVTSHGMHLSVCVHSSVSQNNSYLFQLSNISITSKTF